MEQNVTVTALSYTTYAVRQVFSVVLKGEESLVSALSLTRLQLSGTNCLFLSAILPLSALLNLP